jgi:predicted DNA-binding protein (UPF0251 family)
MPRPKCRRWIGREPEVDFFKPRGVPLAAMEQVVLSVDELEALRLADLDGLYQEQAAERMHVSRATFGRIVESAHRKVADALANGKALKVSGGAVDLGRARRFECPRCSHAWRIRHGTGRPTHCPACNTAGVNWSDGAPSSGRSLRSPTRARPSCRRGESDGTEE